MLFPSKIHFPSYYFFAVRSGFGCFPGRSVVFGVFRSGIGLFSRTEGALLALQVPGGSLPQLGIFLCRESSPVGSKCMQVGEDSFPEKDISVQVFLFLDFLFLKRETVGKFIPLSLSL